MFGTIRKHQTWLWVFIIIVMIIGMVTWTNTTGSRGNQQDRQSGDLGAIDNRPVTQDELLNAKTEAALMYFLQSGGEWPDSGSAARANYDLTMEAYKRLFLIRKLDQYNIRIDSDSVAQLGGLIVRQSSQKGQGSSSTNFFNDLKNHGATPQDFQRFLAHDLGIQQLASVIGLSGKLVTTAEIESLYAREHQELAVDAVFFSASNYLATVPVPSEQLLSEFYSNNLASYRVPTNIEVSYVHFNVTNFLAEAEQKIGTNLTSEVDSTFLKIGTNYVNYGKTPEEAKTKLRELIIRQIAGTNIYGKAVAFQNELLSKEPLQADSLATLAKEKGLETKVTKPFDAQYGPNEFHLETAFLNAVFRLTPESPLLERPYPAVDGIYIIALKNKVPSRIPSLEEIHSRVLADYKHIQALRLAQESGRVFTEMATNQLAQGKSFDAIAASARVHSVAVPPFSYSTQTLPEVEDHIDLATFREIAFATPVGKVSDLNPTREGGVIIHSRERLPLDQAKMKADLPAFTNLVRQRRENEAFNLWFNKEASAALQEIPAIKQKMMQGRT